MPLPPDKPVTVAGFDSPIPADLATVIAAWPTLPDPIKAAVAALIKVAECGNAVKVGT